MVDKIKQLCKTNDISVMELESILGLSSIRRWDKNTPSFDKVAKIAEYFNVSIDYLADRTEDPSLGKKAPLLFTTEELDLIKKYRDLDRHGKRIVDFVLDSEAERSVSEKPKIIPKLRELSLSLSAVSAGTGIYLTPVDFDRITVLDNNMTRRADFVVPVKGDSMEPTYSDGDHLLVEKTDFVDVGEIGVFVVNGEGFVKKRGDGVLISLNSEYADIPLDDSARCNGRVIGVLDPSWIV